MTEIPQATNLKTLMEILEDEFAKNKTIEGNVARLTKIMETYKSNAQDWKEYALFDPSRYTRNLVDDGNGKYNLIIQCWGPGQESSIQDHNLGHCIFKVIHGEIRETVYEIPKTQNGSIKATDQALLEKKQETWTTHSVSHISNKIGAHRISNKSEIVPAVSIHLYSPPVLECNYYSPKSSRPRLSGKLPLHSKFGELVHPTARRFKISNSYQFSNDYYRAAAGSNVPSVFGKTVKISRPKPE